MNYKVGDRIVIINMDGEPSYTGRHGTIEYFDSIGQLHGTWGGLALIPEVDQFEKVDYTEEDIY